MAINGFLNSLFQYKPDDLYYLIWTFNSKTEKKISKWFKKVDDQATQYIEDASKENDVYVGVALSPKDFGEYNRCPAGKTVGIMGLWADIDVLHAVHKKTNLPPTIKDAVILLDEIGIPPTIILDSGHGIQAWWIFKEPWIFEDDDDRAKAAELAKKWIGTYQAKASKHGWDVDSTQDLARVLRVAGTVNHKDIPKPVKVYQQNEFFYEPSDFDEYIVEPPNRTAGGTQEEIITTADGLELNPAATPPFDKFEALTAIEPNFRCSWERTRKDFQDQSASSYDMSLANYAAMCNWSGQEITNLLIASRKKHGDDLKLRTDYYARTILKARKAQEKSQAQEVIDEYAATGGEEPTASEGTKPKRNKELKASVSALIGVQIKRIIKYVSDPPTYRLETAHGNITLGDVSNLIGQGKMRNLVAAATGKYLPKFKGERWDNIAQILLDICETEDIGSEATDQGTVHSWLVEYFEEFTPVPSLQDAIETKHPFYKEDQLCVFGSSLRKWLTISRQEKMAAKTMGAMLRAYGCNPETVNVQEKEKQTTRSIWRIPDKTVLF